jgi:hypothetical protein
MHAHHTQTNEVGRCGPLLLAMPPGPLSLIELGASAGLCLLLDRYRYDFGSKRLGDADSPVLVECSATGAPPIPDAPPTVVWRLGIDLDPLDVTDPDATGWLLSLIWADHPRRRARLEAAIRVARRDPPPLRRGDLLDDLRPALAEAPPGTTLVVFHTAVRPYVPPERWQELDGLLAEHSQERDVSLVSFEGDGKTRLAADAGMHAFVLERTTFSGGRARTEHFAKGHPHGSSIRWEA